MKTLKKVLAMTLAFATAMTMFISASAFTDDADITQTEAVGALSSLGIIKGNSDGSFAPQKTVTRGEMAKMIYVLRTGKDDGAVTYSSLSTTFTDISSTWAAPYIKYCASLGIISGRSATTFDPDATVTGLEAGKMLLVCMGYNAEKAGLTGSTWAINTAALGDENKLFQDVYQDLAVALYRENAAQEIYNTLDAKTVRFDGDDQSYTNKTQLGTDMETVGEKFLDLESVTGTLLVSGNVGLTSGDDDYLEIDRDDTEANNAGKMDTFEDVTTDYSDLIGQDVKILYKTTSSTTGKKETKVYGVYASDENTVVEAKASDIDTVSNETKIKIDGKKYSIDDTLTVYTVDGVDKEIDTLYTLDDTNATLSSTVKTGNVTNANVAYIADAINDSDFEVKAISNDDNNKIDVIILYEKAFSKLTVVNSTSVTYRTVNTSGDTTTTGAKLDLEDDTPVLYSGYAKDDYVFVDVDLFTGNNVITKADIVSGKTQAAKSGEVELNGTWYDLSYTKDANNTPKTGNTYTVYVYGTYAYYVEGTASTDLDTLVVKSIGDYKSLDSGYETKVIFDDGTEKVINVEAIGTTVGDEQGDSSATDLTKDSDLDKLGFVSNAMYTYEEDGGDYTLVPVSQNALTGAGSELKAKTMSTAEDRAYYSKTETISGDPIDDDAVIYLQYISGNDTKYKVVSGVDISGYKSMTVESGTNSIYVVNDDGDVVYAYINTKDNAASDSTLYGVVTSAYTKTNADGDRVVYLDMITADGKKTEVETDETKIGDLNNGDIVKFDGDYNLAKNIDILSDGDGVGTNEYAGYGAIDKTGSGTSKLITFYNDLASAKIVSDTTIIYIDMSNSSAGSWTAEDGGSITSAEALDSGKYKANAFMYVDNSDSEIALLVVDTEGELKDDDKNVIELAAK